MRWFWDAISLLKLISTLETHEFLRWVKLQQIYHELSRNCIWESNTCSGRGRGQLLVDALKWSNWEKLCCACWGWDMVFDWTTCESAVLSTLCWRWHWLKLLVLLDGWRVETEERNPEVCECWNPEDCGYWSREFFGCWNSDETRMTLTAGNRKTGRLRTLECWWLLSLEPERLLILESENLWMLECRRLWLLESTSPLLLEPRRLRMLDSWRLRMLESGDVDCRYCDKREVSF